MKKWLMVGLWVICGVYNYGVTVAHFEDVSINYHIEPNPIGTRLVGVVMLLSGPFGTVVLPITPAYETHSGWRL